MYSTLARKSGGRPPSQILHFVRLGSMQPCFASMTAYDSDDFCEGASDEEVLELTSGSGSNTDEEAYWLDSAEISDASSDSCEVLDFHEHASPVQSSERTFCIEQSDLLKNILDYCSHAWPSSEVHESLLHNMLHPENPSMTTGCEQPGLKDPADLSALLFSDGSDEESTKESQHPPVDNSCSDTNVMQPVPKVGLRPSALNPQLTSKHAKKAHMQRLVHQEIERKRLEDLSSSNRNGSAAIMRRRHAESLLPVLEDLGYTLEQIETLVESCNDDVYKVQMEVDALLEASQSKSDTWLTSVTRKRQRETGLKELRKQELGVLKSRFGNVMRELEVRGDGIPAVNVSDIPSFPQSGRDPADEQGPCTSATGNGMPGMPEVSTIKHMSRADCRKLLRQMRPLVHAPAVLYKALAARALDEYAKAQPRTYSDCRQIAFWQFAGSERSGGGPDRF